CGSVAARRPGRQRPRSADLLLSPHPAALLRLGLVDSASRRLYGGGWDGMSREDLDSITTEHFSSSADAPSPYVDHLEADLAGLPPVFIAAAGLDPLRDDSEALHVRLEEAGTPVDYHLYPAVLHSFLHFGRMLDDAGDVLTRSAGFAAAHL